MDKRIWNDEVRRQRFIQLYIKRAKVNFDHEIETRRKTRIHDLMVMLGISKEEVEKIWHEN